MNPKLATILGLLALAVIFIIQNTDVVELRFLFWKLDMSRALMFAFLVVVGFVIGWFLRGHRQQKTDNHDSDR